MIESAIAVGIYVLAEFQEWPFLVERILGLKLGPATKR
jgi:hypothetical protein